MKFKLFGNLFIAIPLIFFFTLNCSNEKTEAQSDIGQAAAMAKSDTTASSALVTFIELGSTKCIPCQKMEPILKAVEQEYGDQIRVVFYDVWQDNAPAKKYGIRLIPTQVFLDKTGKEFFRHEGFFPKEEIDNLLSSKGLVKITVENTTN